MRNVLRASQLLLPLALLCVAATKQASVQSDAQFKAAFDNHSSSQSFVMITAVDARSGLSKAGCTTPATLVHAIEIERNLTPDYSIKGPSAKIALAAPNHHFVFKKDAALRTLRFEAFETNGAEACHVILSGSPAYQEDRTGKIKAGQP